MRLLQEIDALVESGKLLDVMAACKYGRYHEDPSLPKDRIPQLLLEGVQDYLRRPHHKGIAIYSDSDAMLGLVLFKFSTWDTEHFGYPVAVVEGLYTRELGYHEEFELADQLLRGFNAWCKDKAIRFVSARIPAKHLPVVHGFEEHGFRFIETWIFNKWDLAKLEATDRPLPSLRRALPSDTAAMLEYSTDAFATQRFHADQHIPPNKADSLYRKWILSAVSDPNQEVLTADVNGKPAAFMVFYRNDLRRHLGLQFVQWKMALVDPAQRGKGLGTDFFLALLHNHRKASMDVVDSGLTMRNSASLNLHNKLGCKIITTVVTLHKWFD